MDRAEGFITPPPGLIPEQKTAKANEDSSPRRRGETTESFPPFFPRPLGAPLVAPAGSAVPATVEVHKAGEWMLTAEDGTAIRLTAPTVVGRNPSATSALPTATTLALTDPEKSLSKSHALLEPAADGLSVTDLHSTNGVAVMAPSGAVTVAEPGNAVNAMEGSILVLGNVRFTLSRA